ncbi:MAG TPA: phosphate acyltransferase PlsX [Rubrobacteraceae bacterium]|nr:phosphate acyltransferase PlsX [Rubrobacteraceae bacterium]
MRIAVDALGGDRAPREIVAGAVAAAGRLPRDEVFLVGDPTLVEPEVDPDGPPNLSLREAGGPVGMGEEPASALRARPDASVAVAAEMVREGGADALFSAGNTGATVAAALLRVGRLQGCRRPAIATVLPLTSPVLLLDAGATVMCRPQDLLNFAILGGVFARRYFDLEGEARVGLINVGEEPGKGNDLSREAYRLLSESPGVRFVGNVEGREIGSGVADVLVTDGFTGNVVLKSAEGVAREILAMLRSAMTGGPISRLAAGILRPRLRSVRDRVDPENYGGSFLLGVRGSVVIGHGNSGARGVENALVGISRTGAGLAQTLEAALAAAHAAAGDAP